MSESELALFNSLSYKQRYNYLLLAYQASEKSRSLYPSNMDQWNGIGDAYRHAQWNALGAKRLGLELIE